MGLVQATTGSPAMKFDEGARVQEEQSVNEAPRLIERATPLKLRPPLPKTRVSRRLPESLYPTTTMLPHQAVDVSLCVKPEA